MKKRILFLLVIVAATLTSCLNKGVPDSFPTYDLAEVSGVSFEFRALDDDENQVVPTALATVFEIDEANNVIDCTITVPPASAMFPESDRAECTQSNIAGYLTISEAAICTPMEGAVKLGGLADWSVGTSKYLLTAADGTEKIWTINIVDFIKE